ncbi:35362_t:CDS:2, partial [Gigaspora margarita]
MVTNFQLVLANLTTTQDQSIEINIPRFDLTEDFLIQIMESQRTHKVLVLQSGL